MTKSMTWASAVSEQTDARHAAMEASGAVAERLDGAPPDIAFVFLSPHHRADAAGVSTAIAETLLPRHVVGCSARGIIGEGREIEERPGLSITAARLPGVDVHTFRLDDDDLPDEDAPPRAWEAALGVPASEASGRPPHFVVFADPFSFSADRLLRGLDYAYPQSAKVGGLASASEKAGGNALFVDGDILTAGCVGAALGGAIAVDTVVAQGCRAIGDTMRVTRARQNFVLELDGKPPLEVLRGLVPRLSERDQKLVRTSLFLGVSADALTEKPQSGEYLIRNILGVSPDNGALAIGELPRVGQAVQFHLRDALASAEDLDQRIGHYADALKTREGGHAPAGALLFSCLGRGMHLYGRPDHDTDAFRERLGNVPLGGFFANGEIGQVRGVTHLHGFTSSFAVFRTP